MDVIRGNRGEERNNFGSQNHPLQNLLHDFGFKKQGKIVVCNGRTPLLDVRTTYVYLPNLTAYDIVYVPTLLTYLKKRTTSSQYANHLYKSFNFFFFFLSSVFNVTFFSSPRKRDACLY